MKPKLIRTIFCKDVNSLSDELIRLHIAGYKCLGIPLNNYAKGDSEWKRGMRYVNIYSDKTFKFAVKKTTRVPVGQAEDSKPS